LEPLILCNLRRVLLGSLCFSEKLSHLRLSQLRRRGRGSVLEYLRLTARGRDLDRIAGAWGRRGSLAHRSLACDSSFKVRGELILNIRRGVVVGRKSRGCSLRSRKPDKLADG
jgi:hypothetical protein